MLKVSKRGGVVGTVCFSAGIGGKEEAVKYIEENRINDKIGSIVSMQHKIMQDFFEVARRLLLWLLRCDCNCGFQARL